MNDENTTVQVSIERRAKKHVKGRCHTWFAVCSPGCEQVLRAELASIGLTPTDSDIPGGVEFEGRPEAGFLANLRLRTAARILVRVAEFKARAVEDVFRETALVPWEAWIPCGCAMEIQPTVHASRIESDTLLQSTIRDAILRRFQVEGLEPPRLFTETPTQRLLARLDDDRLTLSLDSSGELLHRRGWRRESVAAPIRENLASSILLAAGYDGGEALVDAMCGSGTFAIEAALISLGIPPGASASPPRRFAFIDWPVFSMAAWNHMVTHAAARPADDLTQPVDDLTQPADDLTQPADAPARPTDSPASPIFARDIDPTAIHVADRNAASAGVADAIAFESVDFLRSVPPPCPPGLLVMNPPYGLRLEVETTAGAMYRSIARAMQVNWHGWRYAVVMPEERLARAWPIQIDQCLRFAHGGLRAFAAFGRIP